MEHELNQLIDKYHKYIDVINGVNEFEVFSKIYNETRTSCLIDDWVHKKFNKTSIKCPITSRKYREDGNRHFKAGANISAVLCYTKSVSCASFDSLEFNLSVGNRSAALLHLGEHKDSIRDLELCLYTLNYPLNKKFKLYQRLIQAYIDLKLGLKAKQTHENLLKYLDENTDQFDDKQSLKYTETATNLNELIDIIIAEEEQTPQKPKRNDFILEFFPERNKHFNCASPLISLKFDRLKGRYVEATLNIKSGDVLFIEKTEGFVPIAPDEDSLVYRNVCYNCFQETCAGIPCDNCDEIFCSLSCKTKSWTRYHRFECVGSASVVWKNFGVNYLAFRVFLIGFQSGLLDSQIDDENIDVFEKENTAENWYKKVNSLLSNVAKMKGGDLLPHCVSALILVSYLKNKTDFFRVFRAKYNEYSAKSDNEIAQKIGAVLLKHILQVICNASIIENVRDEFYRKFNSDDEIKESGMFVQGTGLFPAVSLMNHSCDSNVTNYFLADTIIVKANRDIKAGDEILNCYGHDCRSESTEERKASLKFQYYFECSCSACLEPSRPEMYERGLCCPKCNNCSLNPVKNVEIARCLQCNYEFITEEHAKILIQSEKIYKKWQTTRDVKYLEQCLQMEKNIYYKYNYKLYDLIQDLQTYYKNTGVFFEWWKYTETLLDLDKKIYGSCSLKYGLNLRETLIGLLVKFLPETKKMELLDQAEVMLHDAMEIFQLYYPKNKLKYDFVTSRLNANSCK